jgi:hypothetical protein
MNQRTQWLFEAPLPASNRTNSTATGLPVQAQEWLFELPPVFEGEYALQRFSIE